VEKPLGKCPVGRIEKKCEDKIQIVENYAVRVGCRYSALCWIANL
jgi:hypothetical protein